MKLINTPQFKKLIKEHPNGGIVFCESDSSGNVLGEILITDGNFGATALIPKDGDVFDFDWNIQEYSIVEWFLIFDNNDILQMIKLLISGADIKLKSFYEE